MVNVRCVITPEAAAKVAYVARLQTLSRREVYARLIEKFASDLEPDQLRFVLYGVLRLDNGRKVSKVPHAHKKAG